MSESSDEAPLGLMVSSTFSTAPGAAFEIVPVDDTTPVTLADATRAGSVLFFPQP